MRLSLIVVAAATAALLPALLRGECPAPVSASLVAADKTFGADTDAHGVEGWVKHFAPDARLLGPEDAELVGLPALAAYYRKVFSSPERLPKWTPLHADCSVDGSLGFTYGTWVTRTDPKGGGQYVSVWRKQPDGAWKVLFDLGNKR